MVSFALVAVLFARPVNGTRRWFGMLGVGVQPSELAKLAAVLFTAAILERRMSRIQDVSYSLLPIGVVVATFSGLILLEPDYGTAIMLLLIISGMVFAAGLPYRYVAGITLAALPLLAVALMGAEYRRRRSLCFWIHGATRSTMASRRSNRSSPSGQVA